MLESTGNETLGTGNERALREWVLRQLLACCRGADGDSLEKALDADPGLLDRQLWGLSRLHADRPYPRLLRLDLGGRALASVEPPVAGSDAAAIWGGLLCGVRNVAEKRRTEAALREGGLDAVQPLVDRALRLKPAAHDFRIGANAPAATRRHMSVTGG